MHVSLGRTELKELKRNEEKSALDLKMICTVVRWLGWALRCSIVRVEGQQLAGLRLAVGHQTMQLIQDASCVED